MKLRRSIWMCRDQDAGPSGVANVSRETPTFACEFRDGSYRTNSGDGNPIKKSGFSRKSPRINAKCGPSPFNPQALDPFVDFGRRIYRGQVRNIKLE